MKARGQAMTETALGLLVVVPIVLGLLSFAELGFSSLKVKEAGYAAVWDLPAHQTHDLNRPGLLPKWSSLRTQGTLAATSAAFTQRYQQLQGLGNETGNPNVLLKVERVEVRCEERQNEGRPFKPSFAELHSVAKIYDQAGSAVRCRVEAGVRIAGVPDFTLSIFHRPILSLHDFTLCATRAVGGGCGYGPLVLTDPWAFTGKQENSQCLVSGCDNPAAKDLPIAALNGISTLSGGLQALTMAKLFRLVVPSPEPNASFAGSESDFIDGVVLSHGDADWAPTPFTPRYHQVSYQLRKDGYPGVELRDPAAGLSAP